MRTAWENYHRRAAVVRTVLAQLERRRDGSLPWDRRAQAEFEDREDLLLALHKIWSDRLATRVELAIETDRAELVESVGSAWHDLAREFPGLRKVLDTHAQDPALGHIQHVEHRLLAVAAGLATLQDPPAVAAAEGARLARVAAVQPPVSTGILERLLRRPGKQETYPTRAPDPLRQPA